MTPQHFNYMINIAIVPILDLMYSVASNKDIHNIPYCKFYKFYSSELRTKSFSDFVSNLQENKPDQNVTSAILWLKKNRN